VAVCCKAWYHVSREEEFWCTRYLAEFHPSETVPQIDYRRKYIAQIRVSCWHCKNQLELNQIESMSPYFNRPLCYNCRYQNPCVIRSFASLTRRLKISRATLDHLSIPSFVMYNAKSSFLILFTSKIQPYAETRRQLLLSTLDTQYPGKLRHEVREQVQAYDFGQICYSIWRRNVQSDLEKALIEFCIKWRKRENVNKSVEKFLEDIKQNRV
jgi:hypothetical protein